MRVLHILNELRPSGAEVMLFAAAPYWRKKGIEGEILATGGVPGTFGARLEEAGYSIHHVPFSGSYSFLKRVYQFLRKQNYDALHIHTERANFWYALVGFLSGNRNIVRTIHNVFSFKGKLRVERLAQRWIMRRVFGVVSISISPSVEANELRAVKNPSQRVPNWFDSTRFRLPSLAERSHARKGLAIPDDTVVLTSVGGCSSVKNHPAIIEALAALPVDAPILYLHVGPEADGQPERELAEAFAVSGRVRFLGTLENVVPVLHASDVYAMPSLYEGCPIAAIEAMAAGLPCIFADVPGLRDFREAGDGVYWAEPTAESIGKALLSFLERPLSGRCDGGLNLSRYAHERFAIETGAEEYARLYLESIGAGRFTRLPGRLQG